MPAPSDDRPVLILGAGVNGLSAARELLLNGIPVVVSDTADLAFGATSKSSRLIHGGLRYLEYGDFALVRESLEERERLLQAAPQFVRPLRLHIPVGRRLGGFVASGLRFVGLQKWPGFGRLAAWSGAGPRGLVTVEAGLRFYDFLAGSSSLPPRSTARVGESGPPVDPARFGWLCSYSDCQMVYPERYVVALADDCFEIASETGVRFELLTYHRAHREGETVRLAAIDAAMAPGKELTPSCIINATGAWGDLTLGELPVPSRRLFSGTKGSHIFTSHAGLREALGDDAIYAEAADGRLVFILPYGPSVMIGTTDDRFEGRPEDVHATAADVEYLVGMANEVFPQIGLAAGDVFAHCCGVRPLPYVPSGSESAIPRGHWIETTRVDRLPIHTLVGGKLTTCRALGEEAAKRVVEARGGVFVSRTADRPVPGSSDFPKTAAERRSRVADTARTTGWPEETVDSLLDLLGTATFSLLGAPAILADRRLVANTPYPRTVARWMIEHESVTTLSDLIERRLMLALDPRLAAETIHDLGELWTEVRGPSSLAPVLERLRILYGVMPDQRSSRESS